MNTLACPFCSARLELKNPLPAGTLVKCSFCQFTFPADEADTAIQPARFSPASMPSSTHVASGRALPPPLDFEEERDREEESDRPRRKKKKKSRKRKKRGWHFPRIHLDFLGSGSMATWGLLLVVVAVVWFGVALMFNRIAAAPIIMAPLGIYYIYRALFSSE